VALFKNIFPVRGRPTAELLTVGTELVTGTTVNTNASYLGRELTQLGFRVEHQCACRDETEAIQEALQRALARSQVIVICGGLGPTPDDITRQTLAEFFGVPLVLSRAQYRQIQRYYRSRGRTVPAIVKREAYFPANAKPVFNEFGIALGFIIEERGRVILVVPGVPRELVRLFETRLKPFLQGRFSRLRPLASLIVKTVGLSEPAVMRRLGRRFFRMGQFEFGIYPEAGEVGLRVYADSPALIRRLRLRVKKVLGRHIYSFSEESLEAAIGRELVRKKGTLAIAESCTGGRIAELLTGVPGASRYLAGAVVAYQNGVKTRILDVPDQLIKRRGAVSREAVLRMAFGVRARFGATLGIGVTGIAGPGGGSREKPVGLVYLAIASAGEKKAWKEQFRGERLHIQDRAAKKALEYLWRWLKR